MAATAVEEVRRFTRIVTARVGALSDRFLGLDRPLGEALVLWEIGREGSCEVRLLRARLGLDSGYVSRVLRSLEADGVIEVEESKTDRRTRVARLTRTGRQEIAVLDQRSDALAESLLEPLSSSEQDRLVAAMREVERLLSWASVEIRPVDPEHPDAQYCLAEYVAELNRRSDRGFDPSVGATALPHEVRPPAGEFFVGYLSRRADRLRRGQAPRWRPGRDQAHVGRSRGSRTRHWPPLPRAPRGSCGGRRRSHRAHREERRARRGAQPVPQTRVQGLLQPKRLRAPTGGSAYKAQASSANSGAESGSVAPPAKIPPNPCPTVHNEVDGHRDAQERSCVPVARHRDADCGAPRSEGQADRQGMPVARGGEPHLDVPARSEPSPVDRLAHRVGAHPRRREHLPGGQGAGHRHEHRPESLAETPDEQRPRERQRQAGLTCGGASCGGYRRRMRRAGTIVDPPRSESGEPPT
jgi:DNA-binding MarR family transcriptional regulator